MKHSLNPSISDRRLFLWLLTFLFGITSGHTRLMAQRNCGSMDYLEDQLKSYPHMRRAMHDIDMDVARKAKIVDGEIVIPVVVHVVYHNAVQNISDRQILSQIEVLNQDFRRQNPDRHNTPVKWQRVATDSRISFALAKVDPDGNPTSGITRTYTPKATFYAQDNGVKYRVKGGVDAWAPHHYLNIWVCPLGSGVLGYAQFPGGGSDETDGVVISYRHFGTMGTVSPPFDGGRTATHEVGHWLNLRHIWGDGDCSVDDHVSDTPPTDRPHHGCLTYAEACGGQAMVQNFMDYTDDACMNLFTQGQAARMRALFAPGGYRRSIMESPALGRAPESSPPMVYLLPPGAPELLTVADRYARLRWDPVEGVEKYHVRLRPAGSRQWLQRAFSRPFVNPSQLSSCTDYELQVASISGGDTSVYSRPMIFSTSGCSGAPPVVVSSATQQPSGLQALPQAGGQVLLRWNSLTGASEYKIQFKQVGRREVVTKYVTRSEVSLSGLQTGSRYLFRVRAHYPERPGPYSDVEEFTYGTMASVSYRSATPARLRTKFFPDPGILWVRLPIEEAQSATIRIYEPDGITLVQDFGVQNALPNKSLQFAPDFLAPGKYLLEVEDADGFRYREEVTLGR